jgi:hypothetical protein
MKIEIPLLAALLVLAIYAGGLMRGAGHVRTESRLRDFSSAP